ncbi:MAG: hypothetical protein O6913_10610, partial [Chloroflexi bacterium]|nr:hypothetical protein [Chloroflexota bacterium]
MAAPEQLAGKHEDRLVQAQPIRRPAAGDDDPVQGSAGRVGRVLVHLEACAPRLLRQGHGLVVGRADVALAQEAR